MIGYAATSIFTGHEVLSHTLAKRLVELVPEDAPVKLAFTPSFTLPAVRELRCHELARAVSVKLREMMAEDDFRVVDGRMGCVDHTWLELPAAWRSGSKASWPKEGLTILDPYCPGRHPLVQLIDAGVQMVADAQLPTAVPGRLRLSMQYERGPERTDIDQSIIDWLLKLWSVPT